jgi:hypothetical protein
MHLARPILMAALVIALAAYAFDCPAMSTPDEAMQCCDSMPCPSQGHEHSEDCCKTMTVMHAPFVQPHSVSGVSFSLVLLAILPGVSDFHGFDISVQALEANSHAPPIPQTAAPIPLRI